jgi:hypothetical protein
MTLCSRWRWLCHSFVCPEFHNDRSDDRYIVFHTKRRAGFLLEVV